MDDADSGDDMFEGFFRIRKRQQVVGVAPADTGPAEVIGNPGGLHTLGEGGQLGEVVHVQRVGAADREADAVEHDPMGNGELVLLLEDDAMVRGLLQQLLEGLGYRVEAAERGSEALSILEGEPGIALLLTDVMLPGGMNGHDVARKAVELHPGLPVVFASGYSPAEIGPPPDFGGGVRVLQKPFSRAELSRAVSSALGRRP